jgi:hypothetical protein
MDVNKTDYGCEHNCLKVPVLSVNTVSDPHKHLRVSMHSVIEVVPIGLAERLHQRMPRVAPPDRSTSFDPLTSRLRI